MYCWYTSLMTIVESVWLVVLGVPNYSKVSSGHWTPIVVVLNLGPGKPRFRSRRDWRFRSLFKYDRCTNRSNSLSEIISHKFLPTITGVPIRKKENRCRTTEVGFVCLPIPSCKVPFIRLSDLDFTSNGPRRHSLPQTLTSHTKTMWPDAGYGSRRKKIDTLKLV